MADFCVAKVRSKSIELEAPLDNLKVFNTVKKIPKGLVEELRVVARGVRDSHQPF